MYMTWKSVKVDLLKILVYTISIHSNVSCIAMYGMIKFMIHWSLTSKLTFENLMIFLIKTLTGLLEGEVNIWFCELAGIPHTRSSLPIPNPIIVDPSTVTSDEKEDFEAQTSELNKEIHRKFLKLDSKLLKSLRERILQLI